jgi:hypothetical protein
MMPAEMRGATRDEGSPAFRRGGGEWGGRGSTGDSRRGVTFGRPRCLMGVMDLQARRKDRAERFDGGSGMVAFESFFRDHYRAVVRLAWGVVGDSHRAQDVAQDVSWRLTGVSRATMSGPRDGSGSRRCTRRSTSFAAAASRQPSAPDAGREPPTNTSWRTLRRRSRARRG